VSNFLSDTHNQQLPLRGFTGFDPCLGREPCLNLLKGGSQRSRCNLEKVIGKHDLRKLLIRLQNGKCLKVVTFFKSDAFVFDFTLGSANDPTMRESTLDSDTANSTGVWFSQTIM
jgi:hypothetical protein